MDRLTLTAAQLPAQCHPAASLEVATPAALHTTPSECAPEPSLHHSLHPLPTPQSWPEVIEVLADLHKTRNTSIYLALFM